MNLPEGIDLLDFGHEIQLAGAVYSGKGWVLVIPFPDEDPAAFGPVPHFMFCSNTDWETLLRQTDLQETFVGPKKAVVRKSQRQIDSNISWTVYRRDEYRCRYCGADDRPLTVDHTDLWENGGITTAENLVSACRQCNKERGRTEYPEWITSQLYLMRAKKLDERVRMANVELVRRLPELEKRRVPLVKVRSR